MDAPFYQKGVFSVTGDGSNGVLTFTLNDMKSVPVLKSIYQVDQNFNEWILATLANNHIDIRFNSTPAKGTVKKFFFELKTTNYSS